MSLSNIAPDHQPVMPAPIVAAMRQATCVVDGTFGAGGHSRALLEAKPDRQIWAIDQDVYVRTYAAALAAEFPQRIQLLEGNFAEMDQLLQQLGVTTVDAVLLDIGVSSMQLDQPERGFSFRYDGPLDMRMGAQALSAADVVNDYDAEALCRIVRQLGEEKMAVPIVRNIVRHRARGRIERTVQLRDIIHEVKQRRGAKIDPATKTFQALRVYVNDELGVLQRGLEAAERVLKPGGVLAVLSFNSLEDRVVKNFLRPPKPSHVSRHLPAPQQEEPLRFELINRKPLQAEEAECFMNPRARSAKLRLARKCLVNVQESALCQ